MVSLTSTPLWENPEALRVLDAMSDLFVALDREYRIVFVNQAFVDLAGQERAAFEGGDLYGLWPDLKGSEIESSFAEVFRTGIPVRFEFFYEKSNFWADVSAYPAADHLHIYFRNITAQKESAKDLAQREETLRSLVDAVPHITWVTAATGEMVYINAKWKEFTGVDGMDVETIRNALHPDDLPHVQEIIRRSHETGVQEPYRVRVRRHDGEYRWHRVKASPLRGADGNVERWIGTSTDVHDEVLAFAALRESEDHGRFRIEASPQVPWLAGPDGMICEFGHQWLELTGMTKEEAEVSQFSVLHPDDAPAMIELWERSLHSGESFDFEHRILARGEYRWVRSRAMARRAESGAILWWYGTTEDIHDRKQAEAAVRRMQESLGLAMKASRMGWWTRSLETDEVIWSPELEELFGLDPGSFHGTEEMFLDHVHPEDVPKVTAAVQGAIASGRDYSVEFRFRRQDGSEGWMEGRGKAHYDAAGKPTWLYGIGIDITESKLAHRRQEETLERLVQQRTSELQFAYQEQESFSYSVSHDLRAPLRSIVATSRILQEDYGSKLPAPARDLLEKQANAGNKLAELIDDLLQLSRVGRTELHPKPVDLSSLFQSVADALKAGQHQFDIERGMADTGDAKLLALVAQNLLENAVKFSPEGGVIRVGRSDGAYFVQDTGVGFPMEYAHKLFQPFQRLHREEEFPGTGIGLATVRRIVERHQGRIWAKSTPGEGTTFSFTLAA
jgi:PAS domain S-box-containing protein